MKQENKVWSYLEITQAYGVSVSDDNKDKQGSPVCPHAQPTTEVSSISYQPQTCVNE